MFKIILNQLKQLDADMAFNLSMPEKNSVYYFNFSKKKIPIKCRYGIYMHSTPLITFFRKIQIFFIMFP